MSAGHTAAAVLNAVLSLVSVALALPVLQQGADRTAAAGDHHRSRSSSGSVIGCAARRRRWRIA
jgi:hypothetical protein